MPVLDIPHVMLAVDEGKKVVCVCSATTPTFEWGGGGGDKLVDKCQVQMEHWDGVVLNINQTCTNCSS